MMLSKTRSYHGANPVHHVSETSVREGLRLPESLAVACSLASLTISRNQSLFMNVDMLKNPGQFSGSDKITTGKSHLL